MFSKLQSTFWDICLWFWADFAIQQFSLWQGLRALILVLDIKKIVFQWISIFVYHELCKMKIDLEKFSVETCKEAQRLQIRWLFEFDCSWHGSLLWRSSYDCTWKVCIRELWDSLDCSCVCCHCMSCLQTLRSPGTAAMLQQGRHGCAGAGVNVPGGSGRVVVCCSCCDDTTSWPGMTGQLSGEQRTAACMQTLPVIQTAELGQTLLQHLTGLHYVSTTRSHPNCSFLHHLEIATACHNSRGTTQ